MRPSDKNRERAKAEPTFLIDYLQHPRFRGDLAIGFRGPSELGVHDRGFRLAQIKFARDGGHRVSTNETIHALLRASPAKLRRA